MKEFLFINPSINLLKLAESLSKFGHRVKREYTAEYIGNRFDTLWLFKGDNVVDLYNRSLLTSFDSDILSIKKPLIPFLTKRKLKEKFARIGDGFGDISYQDYVLLTSKLERGEAGVKASAKSYNEIVADNPEAVIIAPLIPSSSGNRVLSRWRTDYDIAKALGNDCFISFSASGKVVLFRDREELVTVSKGVLKADTLKVINPSFSRFSFEKSSGLQFSVNTNPWVLRQSANVYLINDYTILNFYSALPDEWVRAVEELIMRAKK